MKKVWAMWLGVVFIFALSFNLHAQDASTPDATAVAAMSDMSVLLTAAEMTPSIPAAEATNGSTFYTIKHNPESAEPWPPLPGNVPGLSAWDMGGGVYLLDDRNYAWGHIKKKRAATASSGMMTAMADINTADTEEDDTNTDED